MNPERRIARSNAPRQAETFVCFESFGPFGPSCLFGGGLAHRRLVRFSQSVIGLTR